MDPDGGGGAAAASGSEKAENKSGERGEVTRLNVVMLKRKQSLQQHGQKEPLIKCFNGHNETSTNAVRQMERTQDSTVWN